MSRVLAIFTCVLAPVGAFAFAPPPPDTSQPHAKESARPRPKRPNISSSEQFGLPHGEAAGELSRVLLSRAVQKEIALTDRQASILDDLYRWQAKRNSPLMMSYRSSRDPAVRTEIGRQQALIADEFHKRINSILDPIQARRLLEIRIQNSGIRAYLMPEVVQALDLAFEAEDLIHGIIDDMDRRKLALDQAMGQYATRAYAHLARDDYNGQAAVGKTPIVQARNRWYLKDLDANVEQARHEINRVLTNGQKERFTRMLGEPFDQEKYRGTDAGAP